MKKIGILGGTFNPIHYGHLLLAENSYQQFALDEVLIMPTKNPQYRTISSDISEETRCDMIALAIADNPHFTLSYEELNREGATYTVDTLSIMKEKSRDVEILCFIWKLGNQQIKYYLFAILLQHQELRNLLLI